MADPTLAVERTIMNVMIGIENDRDNFLLQEAQVDLEIVALPADQPGIDYLGLVDALMVVVILDQSQRLFDGRTRNESGADPVMDQSVRHCDRTLAGPELSRDL